MAKYVSHPSPYSLRQLDEMLCGRSQSDILQYNLWKLALAEDFLRVEDLNADERLVRADIQCDLFVQPERAALAFALNQPDVQSVNLGVI